MMLRPERYEDEHEDLRFEYRRDEADEAYEQLRQEAGCTDECETNCCHVQDMLDERRSQKDLEMDFWATRGVR